MTRIQATKFLSYRTLTAMELWVAGAERPHQDAQMADLNIPIPDRPESRRSALELIEEINAQLAWLEHHKKPSEAIRISYGGVFGVMRVLRITPEGHDFLSIVVRDERGQPHTILAPVSQCSFMLSVFVPTAAEPAERVIVGFREGTTT